MTAQSQAPSLWLTWLTVGSLLISVLPILFQLGLFYIVTRAERGQHQGIFGFGQSRAKLYTEERPSTTFADVAGVEAAKSELSEETRFRSLDDRRLYRRDYLLERLVVVLGGRAAEEVTCTDCATLIDELRRPGLRPRLCNPASRA